MAAARFDLEAIKRKIPLRELLERLEGVQFEPSGSNQLAHCPFHAGGKRRTLTIHGETPDHAHCYAAGCGWNGDVFKLWMEKHDCKFPAAVAALAEMAGERALPDEAPNGRHKGTNKGTLTNNSAGLAAKGKPPLPDLRSLTEAEMANLAELRGVSVPALRRATAEGVLWFAYWPVRGDGQTDSRSRSAYCLTDDARWTASFRRMDGQQWDMENKSWPTKNTKWPVGAANLRGRKEVLLVEGAPDALAAYDVIERHGAAERVAVVCMLSGASGIAAEGLEALAGCRVRIFADNDEPKARIFKKEPPITVIDGLEAAGRWYWQLRDAGISADVINLASLGEVGVKDLNDLVKRGLDDVDSAALLFGEGNPAPGRKRLAVMQTTRPQRCRAVEWREIGSAEENAPAEVRSNESAPADSSLTRPNGHSDRKQGGKSAAEKVPGKSGNDGPPSALDNFDAVATCEALDLWRDDKRGAVYLMAVPHAPQKNYRELSATEAQRAVKTYLRTLYRMPKEELAIATELVMENVLWYRPVDAVLPFYAGHRAGIHNCGGVQILVKKSPSLITPEDGEWRAILAFLAGVFPADETGFSQAELFLGWCRLAALSVYGQPRTGQILIMIGSTGDGKSRVQHEILTPLLGGLHANPGPWLTGETDFNSELISACHLMMEDPPLSAKKKDKDGMRQKLKNLAVGDSMRLHEKGRPAITVHPNHRVSISLNPGDAYFLPDATNDWLDKVLLLKTTRPKYLPVTVEERQAWREALRAEMPAFLHYLLNHHEIAEEFRGDRFGLRSYAHPELLYGLEETASWRIFMDEIEDLQPWDLPNYQFKGAWRGKPHELEDLLTSGSRPDAAGMDRLFKKRSVLSLLKECHVQCPDRVGRTKSGGKGGRGRSWLLFRENTTAKSKAQVETATQEAAADEDSI